MQNRHIIYIMLFVHKGQLIISSLQRRYVSYVNCFGKHFAFCVKRIFLLSFLGQEAQTPIPAYCIFLMLRLAALAVCSVVPLSSSACYKHVWCSGCCCWWFCVCVCVLCVACLCVYTSICIQKLYTYTDIYNFSQQISVPPCNPKGGSAEMPSMKLTA